MTTRYKHVVKFGIYFLRRSSQLFTRSRVVLSFVRRHSSRKVRDVPYVVVLSIELLSREKYRKIVPKRDHSLQTIN